MLAVLPWVGVQAQADLPLLLGRIEVPAMMVSAQRLSGLMEQSSPGSSAALGLGIAALSFNPQLQHFDLTQPMVLFLYAMPEAQGGGLEWCFSLGKKSETVPEILEQGKEPVHVKDVGERCFVSRVPGLAEVAAMADLPGVTPEDEEKADILVTLWPATGLARHRGLLRQLQGEGAKLLFRRAAGTDPATMAAARLYHLRFRLSERLLDQVREGTVAVHLAEDGLILKGTLTPQPESPLERFAQAQTASENDPLMVALPTVPGWAGALHLELTSSLRDVLVGYLRDLAMESADHLDEEYFAAVRAVADAWTGQATSIAVKAGPEEGVCRLHRLDLGPGQTGLFPAMGEEGATMVLNQYPGHPDLHLTILEGKGEVIVAQQAPAGADLRAVLRQAMTGTAAETPLYRGEILFRNRLVREAKGNVAAPEEEKDVVPAATPCQSEYFVKFQPEGATFRIFIPAELLDRIDPRNFKSTVR
jgi:hypothetical protein